MGGHVPITLEVSLNPGSVGVKQKSIEDKLFQSFNSRFLVVL